jgi:hypothetical protein
VSDFETVPVAPRIIGITFAFTFHMRRISVVMSLYFKIFSASFLITFLSGGFATAIIIIIIIVVVVVVVVVVGSSSSSSRA